VIATESRLLSIDWSVTAGAFIGNDLFDSLWVISVSGGKPFNRSAPPYEFPGRGNWVSSIGPR
jgi:hypothetical protein